MSNKKEFINLVRSQTSVTLTNDKENVLNKHRKVLHTTITRKDAAAVLGLLQKQNITYENHVGNEYFIHIK